MYNSIQHFNEVIVEKIEDNIKNFINEKKDLADLINSLQENLFELGRDIIVEVLEDMDQVLRGSKERKKGWEIVRKDANSLLTSFGAIQYSRTYYKPKSGGKRRHIIDELVGVRPHEKMSSDVVINALEEAVESTYRKAGEEASYVEEISKQAVMNKVHEIEVMEPELEVDEKRRLRVLYIEADEDHVSLQENLSRKKGRKYNTLMPKLVYVHEGIDGEKSTTKRTVLKNLRYFGGDIKSEDLWLKIADFIDKQYEYESIETIYISGDGAPWIRQGTQWISKSRFVLDNYHLNKYIKKATAHLDNPELTQELRDAIDWPDKRLLKKVFRKIKVITDSETKKEAVLESRRYILNNWDGIEIKAEKGHEIIGCSAEGHVSHVFSQRLSSRPKGWSRKGASQMSELIIYTKNGGKIYDLVMAQKKKEEEEKRIEKQDRLIKELRNSTNKYNGTWNSNVTAVTMGRKTRLYNALRSLVG